jgi:small subunit ribosomal protein S6
MRTYEGMLVVDPVAASTGWDKVIGEIEHVLAKYEAKLLKLDKWGERELAYPIKKRTRGTYILMYFQSPPRSISRIRGDFELSETILRHLILVHEGIPRDIPVPEGFQEGERTPQIEGVTKPEG